MNDRVRAPKASDSQKEELLKYFENNLQALRILNGSDNRAKQRIWIELTHKLNTLDGALKTTSKWAKYWSDIVMYTKTRARAYASGKCRCDRPPNDTEQRLLSLIGHLSLLKMWQHMWDTVEKQSVEEAQPSKNKIEINSIEIADFQGEYSISTGDVESHEYEKLVNEMTWKSIFNKIRISQVITTEDTINASTPLESLIEPKEEEDHLRDNIGEGINNTIEHFIDETVLEEFAENVRTIGNSFSSIGSALNNIASLIEKVSKNNK